MAPRFLAIPLIWLCLSIPAQTQQTPPAPETTPETTPEQVPQSEPELAPEPAPQSEPDMVLSRLLDIVTNIDPDANVFATGAEFTLEDIPVIVITDPRADRMRAMVPIRSVDGLSREELMRLMQANFDSALDARYAVAQGRLWGVFIHPLSSLRRDQFLSALVQTINVARTYGDTYTGGALTFGGGDSNSIYRELLDELRKGQEL